MYSVYWSESREISGVQEAGVPEVGVVSGREDRVFCEALVRRRVASE